MSEKLFAGETAVVSGAASNIGRGIAVALAGEGASRGEALVQAVVAAAERQAKGAVR